MIKAQFIYFRLRWYFHNASRVSVLDRAGKRMVGDNISNWIENRQSFMLYRSSMVKSHVLILIAPTASPSPINSYTLFIIESCHS